MQYIDWLSTECCVGSLSLLLNNVDRFFLAMNCFREYSRKHHSHVVVTAHSSGSVLNAWQFRTFIRKTSLRSVFVLLSLLFYLSFSLCVCLSVAATTSNHFSACSLSLSLEMDVPTRAGEFRADALAFQFHMCKLFHHIACTECLNFRWTHNDKGKVATIKSLVMYDRIIFLICIAWNVSHLFDFDIKLKL